MRIKHTSDNHGLLPKLIGTFDCVVSSGDFFPDCPYQYRDRSKYIEFQLKWLEAQVYDIKKWLGGRPILMVGGNHDFLSYSIVENVLRNEGITCFDLTDKIITHDFVNFYGFPYVPVIDESFAYELDLDDMQEKVDEMVSELNNTRVDVLVCHSALRNILDLAYNSARYGSTILADGVINKINKDMLPDVICHGHIHQPGIMVKSGILFVNSATSQHIIEI